MKLRESSRIETTVSEEDTPQRRRLLKVKQEINRTLTRDNPEERVDWLIAEEPFELPDSAIDKMRRAGPALKRFFEVANRLFLREPWIQRRLEKRITPIYALLNRAQPDALPLMPRPDVVFDRDWNPKFVELEITVCARYDTAAMAEQYGLDGENGLIRNYAEVFKRRWPGKTLALLTAPHPVWWYIIDEAVPIAARLQREGIDALAIGGEELASLHFDGERLLLRQSDGNEKQIHVFDRFIDIYEIAELTHPGMAPLLDAYLAGAVESINTCKQSLDEKEWMCLFWEPNLRTTWRQELGEAHDTLLREMLPRTWRAEPGAAIELESGRKVPIEQLGSLPAEERAFVLKESGTSSTSSGAQSLSILSELDAKAAQAALEGVLANYAASPFILQEIIESPRISFTALNTRDGDKLVTQHGARMKLSVFYVDGKMTNIKFIASNGDFAVNWSDCVEGMVRY
ncbi:hypothetical protein ACXYMO_07545 [Arenibacterium sp. CAU 1754]